jgi:hypothetical protein
MVPASWIVALLWAASMAYFDRLAPNQQAMLALWAVLLPTWITLHVLAAAIQRANRRQLRSHLLCAVLTLPLLALGYLKIGGWA